MEALRSLGFTSSSRCSGTSRGPRLTLPGAFDEAWLPSFAGRAFSKLDGQSKRYVEQCLFQWGNVVTWGPACSGTDSPSWIHAAVEEALSGENIDMLNIHLFSAELNEWKHEWTKRLPMGTLVFSMSQGDLTNLVAQSLRAFRPAGR